MYVDMGLHFLYYSKLNYDRVYIYDDMGLHFTTMAVNYITIGFTCTMIGSTFYNNRSLYYIMKGSTCTMIASILLIQSSRPIAWPYLQLLL